MSDARTRYQETPPAEPPAPVEATESLPPPDLDSPQLTVRALLTGCLMGALLSSCNLYTGLTIGWSLNMSVTAILVSFALWRAMEMAFGTRHWSMLENNLSQTACSSAAAVSSAGLVAPIPALTMMTGERLDWLALSVWVLSVCLVGIIVAIPIRKQMIVVDKLAFPSGFANGEMLKEVYAKGAEAVARVTAMAIAALLTTIWVLLEAFPALLVLLLKPLGWVTKINVAAAKISAWPLPIPKSWLGGYSADKFTLSLDPSLLFLAVGALVGFRGCVSILLGGLLGWLVLAPPLVENGMIRLKVAESLRYLPPGVGEQLLPQPEGYTKYSAEARRLEHMGVMTVAERDRLLGLSDDVEYQETVRKLFGRSQLKIEAELAALPTGVALGDMVRYDADARKLRATGAITPAQYATLQEATSDPQFRAALRELYSHFDYTTTMPLMIGVKAAGWPDDLLIPRAVGHRIQHQLKQERLVSFGRLPEDVVAAVEVRFDEYAARPGHDAEGLAAARDALWRLKAAAGGELLPGLKIEGVVYDEPTATFVAQGVVAPAALSAAGKAAVESLAARPAESVLLDETLGAIARSSRFAAVQPGFADVVAWLLWPGVTLMVIASLVSFGFSLPALARSFRFTGGGDARGEVPMKWFAIALVFVLVFSVYCQVTFFHIAWWAAMLGVVLSFVLAIVASRVAGETNTTPVGAMGKVTQLVFGALIPGSPAANLMTANVTGGAASQCADLMHDLKTGGMIGAVPWKQVAAQVGGAMAGAFAGSAFYLILVPNPQEQLMSEQFAAPAVATWKAVAELFQVGLRALPAGAPLAIGIAALFGVVLPILERNVSKKAGIWIPSASAVGLGLVIHAHTAISMFLGGLIALVLSRFFTSWSARFLIAICAGVVAGESLTSVGLAIGELPFWSHLW